MWYSLDKFVSSRREFSSELQALQDKIWVYAHSICHDMGIPASPAQSPIIMLSFVWRPVAARYKSSNDVLYRKGSPAIDQCQNQKNELTLMLTTNTSRIEN